MLIPVLGVLLLSFALSSGDKPVTPASDAAHVPPPLIPRRPRVIAKKPSVNWPTVSLSEVLSHNPFAAPASLKIRSPLVVDRNASDAGNLPVVSDEELSKDLREALNGKKLHGLIKTSRGFIALIGDDVVREGDLIGTQVRVKTIHSGGVELELVPGG